MSHVILHIIRGSALICQTEAFVHTVNCTLTVQLLSYLLTAMRFELC